MSKMKAQKKCDLKGATEG